MILAANDFGAAIGFAPPKDFRAAVLSRADLADASLVEAAESLSMRRIFTIDSDFDIYRFRDRSAFEVLG